MPSGLEPQPRKVKKEVRLVLLIKLLCSDTVIQFELRTRRLSYKNPPLEIKSQEGEKHLKFKSDLQGELFRFSLADEKSEFVLAISVLLNLSI